MKVKDFSIIILLTLFTLLIPIRVSTYKQAENAMFGYPFGFITANLTTIGVGAEDSADLPIWIGPVSPWRFGLPIPNDNNEQLKFIFSAISIGAIYFLTKKIVKLR